MEVGAFQLRERLARGSMGDVWRANHDGDGFPVAVKFITPEYASRRAYRRHFFNEIRSAAALHHPGIVEIFDYGSVDTDTEVADDEEIPADTPYFAMELAEHGSLEDLRLELDWAGLRSLLTDLLRALGHAHARGVIHRDLKPSNVLLTETESGPRFKASDFGLAFYREYADEADQEGGNTVGTPLYMAPEQFRNRWRDLGPWTDLYGLGCLAWRLATGEPPYVADEFFPIAQAHISDPLPEFEPAFEVPDAFAPWLARLLEKQPADRFQQAADARWALLRMPEQPEGQERTGRTRAIFDTESSSGEITPLEPLAELDASSPRYDTRMPEFPGDQESAIGPTPPRTIEPARRIPPPIPEGWTQRSPPPLETPRMSVGLELFTLREFPTVGRVEERDRLWEALREVIDQQESRLVLIRGDAGVGKTRLSQWLRERAEEVGSAVGHFASHSRQNGDGGGLRGMLTSVFDVARMKPSKAVPRIERWYRERGVERPYEWRAMAELLGTDDAPDARSSDRDFDRTPTSEPRGTGSNSESEEHDPADTRPNFDSGAPSAPALSNAREVRALIRRFFEVAAEERPRVVHLDDLQWGLESLHFLRSYFESQKSTELPVLFVGTVRNDSLTRRPLEARLIDELEERDRVETIELGPMPDADQRELVEELLYLDPDTAHRVAKQARGNPLYAVELVRDWVDRSLLDPGPRGFQLRDEVEPTLPEDLYDVWEGRLNEMTGGGSGDLVLALQVAAALGMEVSEKEWRAACEELDVAFPARLVQVLLRRRLLHETESGWRFAHNMLRRTLVRGAREAGRWEELNRVCARVLADQTDPDDERLAQFWLEAGDRRRALEPLLDAADRHDLRVRPQQAQRLFEQAEECVDAVELDRRPQLDAKYQLRRARVELVNRGNTDAADEALRAAADRAEEVGDAELQARVLTERSHVAQQQHDYERAATLARRAQERLPDDRVSLVTARAAFHFADSLNRLGDTEGANEAFERAYAIARGRYPSERLKSLVHWAHLEKNASNLGAAHEKAREALELSDRASGPVTKARVYNLLGDIARRRGDTAEAREWYTEAEELALLIDSRWLFHVHLGRVQLDIEAGDHEGALRLLERVRNRTRGRRHAWLSVSMLAFELEAAAKVGDWSRFEGALRDLEEELSNDAPSIPESASSLRRAALDASDSDRREEARRLVRAATEIWSEPDESDLTEKLRNRGLVQ